MEQPTDNENIDDEDLVNEHVESLLISGEEASRSGDSKAALAAFNKAISIDPSSDMAWFNRGVLLEAQQDARGARQAFQICLDVNFNNIDIKKISSSARLYIATIFKQIFTDN